MDNPISEITNNIKLEESKSIMTLNLADKDWIWEAENLPKTIDEFTQKLHNSAEYAVFLMRAIIGNLGKEREIIEIDKGEWSSEVIKLKLTEEVDEKYFDRIIKAEEHMLGVDLVARSVLILAWEISKENISFYPCLDKDVSHPKRNNGKKLSFRSADFVRARPSPQTDKGPNRDDAILKNGKYIFDFAKKKQWQTFGWRTKVEDDIVKKMMKDNPEVESFLKFPAFYAYEASSVIFAFPPPQCGSSSSPEEVSMKNAEKFIYKCVFDDIIKNTEEDPLCSLRENIKNYIKRKYVEHKNVSITNQNRNSVTMCLGVANYKGIFFEAKNVKAGYGVFITLDHYLGEKIKYDDLKSAQDRVRSLVSQYLNSWLLEEEQKWKNMILSVISD